MAPLSKKITEKSLKGFGCDEEGRETLSRSMLDTGSHGKRLQKTRWGYENLYVSPAVIINPKSEMTFWS